VFFLLSHNTVNESCYCINGRLISQQFVHCWKIRAICVQIFRETIPLTLQSGRAYHRIDKLTLLLACALCNVQGPLSILEGWWLLAKTCLAAKNFVPPRQNKEQFLKWCLYYQMYVLSVVNFLSSYPISYFCSSFPECEVLYQTIISLSTIQHSILNLKHFFTCNESTKRFFVAAISGYKRYMGWKQIVRRQNFGNHSHCVKSFSVYWPYTHFLFRRAKTDVPPRNKYNYSVANS
jgi:hypothetical protein